jgi:hypothetical protein
MREKGNACKRFEPNHLCKNSHCRLIQLLLRKGGGSCEVACWWLAVARWVRFLTSFFLTFDIIRYEVEVNLRPTVSRPVCLAVRHPSGTRDQFFFPLEICFGQLRVCYFIALSLSGPVCNLLYNCFWALPEQSLVPPYFTASSETPPTWRPGSPYLYPPGTGWPSYTPGHLFTMAIDILM